MNHGGGDLFGLGRGRLERDGQRTEYLMLQRPLQRILSFTRRSIDDVVNNPIAKREVYGYYKLHRQVIREGEIRELERQWNPLG